MKEVYKKDNTLRSSPNRSMKYKYFKEESHYLETMRFLKVSSYCFVIIIFCNSKKKFLMIIEVL